MLTIWQMTDFHFSSDPLNIQLVDAALAAFLAEPGCDILLISGDLTNEGKAGEHRELIDRLRRVQAAGKRVYVITATHDYGLGFIREAPDDGAGPFGHADGRVYHSELRGLYDEFGFRGAIAEYGRNSYVAQLAPGCRLLAMNDDGDGREFCGFYPEHMAWALEQIAQARQDGQVMFGMAHHPSQPPSPIYPIISKKDMMGNYEENTRALADAGLHMMCTGHAHMHNIAHVVTPAGSDYWDVNTGAAGLFPALYRVFTLDGNRMHIETREAPEFPFGPDGSTARETLVRGFDFMLRDIIESADRDYDHFAHSVGGISMSPEQAYKLKAPLHAGGVFLNRITLGGVGTLLCCRHKIPRAVRGQSFKELFLELMRNLYSGQEKYGPDTDIGKALLAIAGRLNAPLRKTVRGLGFGSLPEFLLSLIYDPTPDWTADIIL